jgi:hypothetical protein
MPPVARMPHLSWNLDMIEMRESIEMVELEVETVQSSSSDEVLGGVGLETDPATVMMSTFSYM